MVFTLTRIRFFVFAVFIAMINPSCNFFPKTEDPPPHPTISEVESLIFKAEGQLKAISDINAEDFNQSKFATANKFLTNSREFLKIGDKTNALKFAKQSFEEASEILKEFYQHKEFKNKIKATINDIESKVKNDPLTPLNFLIPKLDNIIHDIEQFDILQKTAPLEKVLKGINEYINVRNVLDTYEEIRLESDVSFNLGEFSLSKAGMSILNEYVKRIHGHITKMKRLHSDNILTIKIKTIGYTDMVNFRKDSPFISLLFKDENIPKSTIIRRKFLNKHLSQKRSETVNNYIKKSILKKSERYENIEIKQEIQGRGEELPPKISSPKKKDNRRRICIIYSHIKSHKQF